jgi:hypothetical protein
VAKTTRKRRQALVPDDQWRHGIERDFRKVLLRLADQQRDISALKEQLSGLSGSIREEIRSSFKDLSGRMESQVAVLAAGLRGIPERTERLERRVDEQQITIEANLTAGGLVEDLRKLVAELQGRK